MKFEQAYMAMLKGYKIKRPCFTGYWYINGVSGQLTIHLANGEEIETGMLDITIRNVLAQDWEIIEDWKDIESNDVN